MSSLKMHNTVKIRDQVFDFGDKPVHPQVPLLLALLALEDDRVDAVLRAFEMRITDADGTVLWPRDDNHEPPGGLQ